MLFIRQFISTCVVLLVGTLTACATNPPPALPTPTGLAREAVIALPALVAEPQQWTGQAITLIAPVLVTEQDRLLTPRLLLTSDPLPDAALESAIWLAQPLPDAVRAGVQDGKGILKLRGSLSPAGAYGRDQKFTYQFAASASAVLEPERTTLVNLADNPQALDRILLRVEGVMLAQQDSALLVNEVSGGGVPVTGARQIKLPRSAIEPGVVDRLNRSGDVRWGNVEVIGWWQDGMLTPFSVSPRPQ